MPEVVADALRHQQRQQDLDRLAAGDRWQGEAWGLVFMTPRGTPLDGRNVTHRFQRLLASNGLARRRFHDLRHSAATFLAAKGVPARVLMEILGHSNIGTTMNLYAHVLPETGREAAARIDEILRTRSA
jgi:integrase